ncbi:COX15/CtaA family protein [Pseudoxanthomonas beigongshangi]|jgi:cytochrome c oxidase assembly protein subunit 15
MNAVARPVLYRHFHRIAWLAVGLALCVIIFGAFVRLSNAGLSCPDWPTCYGRATWPQSTHEVVDHAASAIRPFETHKAWREQVHRHIAATLGMLVLILSLLAARRRRFGIATILVASAFVAAAIPLYMHGEHVAASALAIIGEAILLFAALRWSNLDLARVSVLTLAVIIFQALLGMWTVTWLLKPLVVMGHLLGGLTTFALLVWMAWRATDQPIRLGDALSLRRWVIGGLILLGIQIALGGWVSANYAAVACGLDFPKCVGRWWPPADFSEGFVLWRGIGVDYEGGVLDGASRIAIQMTHRIMAVVVALYVLGLGIRLFRTPGMRGWATLLVLLILAQFTLGILNVKLNLPLHVAVAHNAGAVLLLFTLVSLIARLRKPE